VSNSSVSDDSVMFVDFSSVGKAEHGVGSAWIEKCQMEHGKPVNNLANVLIALRCDPLLCEAIAWDEMQRATFLMTSLDNAQSTPFIRRPLTDYDVSRIQESLQLAGLKNVGTELPELRTEGRTNRPEEDVGLGHPVERSDSISVRPRFPYQTH